MMQDKIIIKGTVIKEYLEKTPDYAFDSILVKLYNLKKFYYIMNKEKDFHKKHKYKGIIDKIQKDIDTWIEEQYK